MKTLKKLAEEPDEVINYYEQLKKYNNLLKENIKLQQELQRKDNIIEELKQNKRNYERENILEMKLHILDNIINELKEKINQFTLIIGYYDYDDEGYDEIGENNNLQEELLNIINLDKIKDIENER